ncbi:oligopeptide ABC transporter permease [Pisciglobus halotolerans]|uniref:Oligopeptide transport system permease protein n=1 Tax=Pisciglobus halotolerans TaxID=745365 RepID=A0A1I3AMB1_9LACT|nr:oligopeptide ABC transporter permease [Pisciglobus halotolerans]SFH51238.1 oligopeptide transport system permease protein [Pisciglobus halotolerans]
MSNENHSVADETIKISPDMFERATGAQKEDSEKIAAPSLSFLQDSWRRLKKNKAAVLSLIVLILMMLASVAAPILAPRDPNAQVIQHANLPPKIPGVDINGLNGTSVAGTTRVDKYEQQNVPDDVYYFLGTDSLGRDLLSRILYGTRVSLLIAFVAALFDLTIGVTYGLVSGWYGGRVDNVMQRILEIISGVPNLVVVILMLLVLNPGITSIIIALAITGWISMARVVRAQTLKLKNQEYILAARALGESPVQIALKHLIPNLSGVIIIQTMFSIPSAIFFEAFLSFIGIGIPAPTASLGTLINDGYKTFRFLPHLMWYPAGVICVLMIAFNLLADGLRDAFDPKMKD